MKMDRRITSSIIQRHTPMGGRAIWLDTPIAGPKPIRRKTRKKTRKNSR